MIVHSVIQAQKTHTQANKHTWLPELAAEGGDLPCHTLTAVAELLQLSLQLPLLGVGARVLLLHLLQLPLQLLQSDHRLIQLEEEEEGEKRGETGGEPQRRRGGEGWSILQRSG